MAVVWQSLNNETDMSNAEFRGENANLSSSADVLHKTSNLAISRCCFADDGKEIDKNETRTCRECKVIVFAQSLNKQICDVLVVVAVVLTKALYKLP